MRGRIAIRFGENLRRCRRRAGMSQEMLAAAAALHRTEVSLLETGRRLPGTDTLVKLACALSVPTDDLLDGIAWLPGEWPEGGEYSIKGGR